MNTKIGETHGFAMFYDTINKKFILNNADGEQVGEGETQDVVEAQAEKLAKTKFPFPIAAIQVSQSQLFTGRITSLNVGDNRVWFSFDEKTNYRTREKTDLSYRKVYEITPANKKIMEGVAKKCADIKVIQAEIQELIACLEKPITPKYFGLLER